MRITLRLLALAFVCQFSNNVAAVDLLDLTLKELLQVKVISATRHPESLFEIPSTVYIIDEQQIRQHGFRDLKDILKFIPGIEYSYPHSWLQGGQRGFSDNWSKTKLMIDGIEVNLLYSGEAFIGHQFMSDNIKRVEVIQGPGSSLYGADAFAGIINIVTRQNEGAQAKTVLSSRIESGERDYSGSHLSVQSRQDFDHWNFQVFLGKTTVDDANFSDFVQTSDFSEPQPNRDVRTALLNQGDNPYVDENKAINLNVATEFELDQNSLLTAQLLYLKDEDGGGLESPEISFTNFKTERDQRLLSLQYSFQSSDNSLFFKFKAEHHNADELNDLNFREVVDGGLSEIYVFDITNSQENIYEAQLDLVSENQKVYTIVGIGFRDKNLPLPDFSLKSPPNTPVTNFESLQPFQSQDMRYIFAQTQLSSADERWKAIIGLRKDDHSIYDAPVTTRIGINYKASSQLVTSFNYGESFRSPTMFELETNAALGPAQQKSYELSVKYQLENSKFQASAYHIDADDLIVTVFDSSQSENFISENEGEVDINGFELLYKRRQKGLSVDAWLDWTDSSLKENISEWQGGILFSKTYSDSHSLALAFRYFGESKTQYLDENFNTAFMDIDSFNTLDFNWVFQKPFGLDNTRLNLNIRNLFDEKGIYPNVRGNDPKGFLLHGINASLGISVQF